MAWELVCNYCLPWEFFLFVNDIPENTEDYGPLIYHHRVPFAA
jgi:hypothetical protein